MIRTALHYGFLVLGMFFFASTAVAMFRFRHVYDRAHAATKCLTGGSLSILIAFLIPGHSVAVILKVILAAGFLFLTNAVSAHALVRAAYRQGTSVEALEPDELRDEGDDRLRSTPAHPSPDSREHDR